MLKKDALAFFKAAGVSAAVGAMAEAAGVGSSAVSQWKTLVPEKCAMRLHLASNGALKYDPAVYTRAKQAKLKSKENHNYKHELHGNNASS